MTVVLKDLARASRRETEALRSSSICTASAAAAVSRDNVLAIFLLVHIILRRSQRIHLIAHVDDRGLDDRGLTRRLASLIRGTSVFWRPRSHGSDLK